MIPLNQAVIRKYPEAVKMARSLIDNPAIIIPDYLWFISLEVETYEKSGSAEVSQKPVIVPGKTTKEYLNDNVAPEPLEWSISGYIPGNNALEIVNYYTPFVRLNTEHLWNAFKNGAIIRFKDMDQHYYNSCVIQNFSTRYEKDCVGKTPFSMSIKEIKVIQASLAELTETEKNAISKAGEAEEMGTTQTEKLDTKSKTAEFLDLDENKMATLNDLK